jgi:hypothetical protein
VLGEFLLLEQQKYSTFLLGHPGKILMSVSLLEDE